MITITLNKRGSQGGPLSTAEGDANWTAIEAAFAQAGQGNGSVTSVGLTTPLTTIFTIGSTPVTSTGNITLTLAAQTGNKILASPAGGGSGTPDFRTLVAADLPVIPITKGGTNSTAALANGKVMVSSGGAIVESSTITTTELSFLDGIGGLTNGFLKKGTSALTTQTAIVLTTDVSGTLPVANGGTGMTTAPNNKVPLGNGTGYTMTPLTVTLDTTGSDVAFTVSGLALTLSIPTATESKRGALDSSDWSLFNNKIGRVAEAGNTIDFGSDIWYMNGAATLPDITGADVGKVLFIKNIDGANKTLTPNGTDVIDAAGAGAAITLDTMHGVILQAYSTSQWYILASFGGAV